MSSQNDRTPQGNNEPQSSLWTAARTQLVCVHGKTVEVPSVTVARFCRDFRLNDKIRDILNEAGFQTIGGLLEMSDAALEEIGLKTGHIAEIKRAAKEFLVNNEVDI
jgi:hypothetical protein